MKGKFENVPVEKGTTILFEHEVKLGEHDVLYQKWSWDGITAESIIFENEDIDGLEEDEILAYVKESPMLKDEENPTFKRSDSGFTFVNFNFDV